MSWIRLDRVRLSWIACFLCWSFFFNDTATTEIYTLSLHDALPICECYMDELARSINMDPLEFRLKNATNDDRLIAVMQAAAEKFGWKNRKKTPGHGFGMSAGFEKGGHVATFAEVAVTAGAVKALRVVEAFEGGAV